MAVFNCTQGSSRTTFIHNSLHPRGAGSLKFLGMEEGIVAGSKSVGGLDAPDGGLWGPKSCSAQLAKLKSLIDTNPISYEPKSSSY